MQKRVALETGNVSIQMAYLLGLLAIVHKYVLLPRIPMILKANSLNFPFKIVASIMLFIKFFTESLISLQGCVRLMFRRRMVDTPIFNVITCGGIPGKLSGIRIQEYKNSIE